MGSQVGSRRFEPPRAKPIIVGYDGSPSSWAAASWAIAEATSTGRPVRLAHVMRWPLPELDGLRLPVPARDIRCARQAATDLVATGVLRCRQLQPDVDVRGDTITGGTIELLAKWAEDAHLLVLGACGQTATPQVLLGSSAAELARRLTTPIMIVRNAPAQTAGGRVVIGVDGSPAGAAAIRSGFDIAARRGQEVLAVHAWSDLPLGALGQAGEIDHDAAWRDATALLRQCLAEERRHHPTVGVREMVALDRPVRALLEQAAGAALLVVGRHGRARGTDVPLGSVSHAALHYAPCPVLLAA